MNSTPQPPPDGAADADPDAQHARNAADWMVDLLVYAPIGFALDVQKFVPEFIERGRSQVALARLIGKLTVDTVGKQLGPLGREVGRQVQTMAEGFGLAVPGPVRVARPGDPAGEAEPHRAGDGGGQDGPSGPAGGDTDADPSSPEPAARVDEGPVPAEGELPITGYDSLGASQVVPRLSSLGPHDLAAVRRYEAAHRARRTILNRVDQLLAKDR